MRWASAGCPLCFSTERDHPFELVIALGYVSCLSLLLLTSNGHGWPQEKKEEGTARNHQTNPIRPHTELFLAVLVGWIYVTTRPSALLQRAAELQ